MRQHIQGLSRLKTLGLLLFVVTALCWSSEAQVNISYGASLSATNITTNSPIVYTLQITNGSSSLTRNVFVTNVFSSSVDLTAIGSNYLSTTISVTSNRVVFNVPDVDFALPAVLQLSVVSSNAVKLTNFVTFFTVNPSNSFSTNLVTTITNIPPTVTDLGVSVSGPPPGPDPYVGDWLPFSVTVTNLGTNTATAIFLTNTFPVASQKWISPTNQYTSNVAVINVGSLTNRAAKTYSFVVQPTNAGTFSFSSVVTSTSSDANSTNNSASTNILVSGFLTNTLVATFLWPTQYFNPENSLMEQRILLANNSPDDVPSARVMVSGIGKTNRLFNAIGTNSGLPFVEYSTTLVAGTNVEMLLQYQVPSHLPFSISDTNLIARAMTNAANLTPPPNLVLYTNLPVTPTNPVTMLNVNGAMYILFPSVKGQTYTIVYSDDISFTTSRVARPSFVAPGNWAYWIDYGPPVTISAPMSTSSRYYKVFINP